MIIIKESLQNFSKSLFYNLILIAELSVCFWLLIMLLNNFFDFGYSANNNRDAIVEDSVYYYAVAPSRGDPQDPETITQVKGFVEELRNQTVFDYMKLDGNLNVLVKKDFWNEKIGDIVEERSKQDFLQQGMPYSPPTPGSSSIAIDASWKWVESNQLDYHAYQHFDLQLIDGPGFTEEDFTLQEGQTTIPIILGYFYHDIFKVGDEFPILFETKEFTAKVVGILEKHSYTYISPEDLQANRIPYLDAMIICPYFDMAYMADINDDIDEYILQTNLYGNMVAGYLVASKDTSNIEVSNVYMDICDRHNMTKSNPSFASRTSGMRMFGGETKESIRVLLILIIVLAFFCIFILISNLMTKIDRNIRTYMIQIMNGASIWHIIWQYILEILMIILPTCAICAILMRREIAISAQYLILVFVFSMICAIASSIIVAMKLVNLKTDELLRRKE